MNFFGSTKWDLVEVASSYRDFGIPRYLAEGWIQQKYEVSKKEAESACYQAYGY